MKKRNLNFPYWLKFSLIFTGIVIAFCFFSFLLARAEFINPGYIFLVYMYISQQIIHLFSKITIQHSLEIDIYQYFWLMPIMLIVFVWLVGVVLSFIVKGFKKGGFLVRDVLGKNKTRNLIKYLKYIFMVFVFVFVAIKLFDNNFLNLRYQCTTVSSLTKLDNGYSIDSRNVYYNGEKLYLRDEFFGTSEKISPLCFEVVNESIIKNKDGVFRLFHSKTETDFYKIPNADSLTFKMVDKNYAIDKDHVFFYRNDNDQPFIIDSLNPQNLKVIATGFDISYVKDNKNIFFYGGWKEHCKIKYANMDAFSIFYNEGNPTKYSKDKKHVFAGCEIIEGADLETFNVSNNFYGEARDKNSIYRGAEKTTVSDPDSFEKIKHNYSPQAYSKDNENVYFAYQPIKNADSKTFEVIGDYFAKDINSVFFCSRGSIDAGGNKESDKKIEPPCSIIESAEPKTFEVFNLDGISNTINDRVYAKDNKHVYYCYEYETEGKKGCFEIKYADPDSFELLKPSLGKDSNSIYFKEEKILNSDGNTFEILFDDYNGFYAKDSKQVYQSYDNNKKIRIILGAEPQSFKKIDISVFNPDIKPYFMKDKNNIYFNGIKVENVDTTNSKIFKITSWSDLQPEKHYHTKYCWEQLYPQKSEGCSIATEEIENTLKEIDFGDWIIKNDNFIYSLSTFGSENSIKKIDIDSRDVFITE